MQSLDKAFIYMVVLSGFEVLLKARRLVPAMFAVWMFCASCGTWYIETHPMVQRCLNTGFITSLHMFLHIFSMLGHHGLLAAL